MDEQGVAEVAQVRAAKTNALDGAMFDAINDTIERLSGERRLCIVLDMDSFAGDLHSGLPAGAGQLRGGPHTGWSAPRRSHRSR